MQNFVCVRKVRMTLMERTIFISQAVVWKRNVSAQKIYSWIKLSFFYSWVCCADWYYSGVPDD